MEPKRSTHPLFYSLATVFLIIASLYLARDFLIPIAFAGLLAFMLNPLAVRLCRLGLPRTVSVILVTILTFVVLALVSWLIGRQATTLANDLPRYRQTIKERVESIKALSEGGLMTKIEGLMADISGDPKVSPTSTAPSPETSSSPEPPKSGGKLNALINDVLSGLANSMGTAAAVILFVIFILLRQEDLSQRITKLAGFNRLTATTRALEEISDRVSQYLLMQGLINGSYGILLGVGLSLAGMPYGLLWGVLGAIFRFIPYVGPIIASVLPIAVSLAFFEGWTQPLLVIGIIAGLELVTNMVLEPILYGKSIGISDLSLIIAIAFWTWIWGSLGLILATPLTVCIVVICRYIPSLEWVDTLMGDKSTPQPHLNFYQQLLHSDREVALATLEDSVEKQGLSSTVGQVVLPALVLTRREHVLNKISDEEHQDILTNLKLGLDILKTEQEQSPLKEADEATADDSQMNEDIVSPQQTIPPVSVFARALHGDMDAMALRYLETTLPQHFQLEISSEPHLIGELVKELEDKKPNILCISAMVPRSQSAATIVCRRLRNRLPNLKILVCRWSLPGQVEDTRALREAGASAVATTLDEAREFIERLAEG